MLSDIPSTPSTSDNHVVVAGMLSSSPGDHERAVRFEETCVLIPEVTKPSRTPRLVTKSYSLPLWRRGAFGIGSPPSTPLGHDAVVEEDQGATLATAHAHVQAETEHVVMKIPVPSFRRASSSMSPSRHNGDLVLTSCMRHRSATIGSPGSPPISSPSSPPMPIATRRHRSPSVTRSDRERELLTEPLRPCCPQCLARCPLLPRLPSSNHKGDDGGEDWTLGMHFTKGALRLRRSASVEAHSGSRGRHMVSVVGKYAIDGKMARVAGVGAVGSGTSLKTVKVDEVDKKMKDATSHVSPLGHGSSSQSNEHADTPSIEQALAQSLNEVVVDEDGSGSPNSTGTNSPSQSSSSLTNGTSPSSIPNIPSSPSPSFVPNFSPRLAHMHCSTLSPEVIEEESFEGQDPNEDEDLNLGVERMRGLTIADGILITPLSVRRASSNESDTLLPLSGISASAPSQVKGSRITGFDELALTPAPSTPPRTTISTTYQPHQLADCDAWPLPSSLSQTPSTPGSQDRDSMRPHRKSSSASSSNASGFRSFPSPASFLRAGVGALKGLSISASVGGAPGISV